MFYVQPWNTQGFCGFCVRRRVALLGRKPRLRFVEIHERTNHVHASTLAERLVLARELERAAARDDRRRAALAEGRRIFGNAICERLNVLWSGVRLGLPRVEEQPVRAVPTDPMRCDERKDLGGLDMAGRHGGQELIDIVHSDGDGHSGLRLRRGMCGVAMRIEEIEDRRLRLTCRLHDDLARHKSDTNGAENGERLRQGGRRDEQTADDRDNCAQVHGAECYNMSVEDTMTRLGWALLLALVGAGSAILAAQAQPYPQYPGQPTKASVWVENRSKTEAIPVTIQDAASDASLRVQVAGTPTVNIGSPAVLPMRAARQPWDYRTVTVRDGEDPVSSELTALGADGWEATGVQVRVKDRIAILLKRPRP